MIFESTDFNFRWDATYNGKMVQDGTYVYKIIAKGADGVIYDKNRTYYSLKMTEYPSTLEKK